MGAYRRFSPYIRAPSQAHMGLWEGLSGSPSGPGLLRRALVSWFLRLDWGPGLLRACSEGPPRRALGGPFPEPFWPRAAQKGLGFMVPQAGLGLWAGPGLLKRGLWEGLWEGLSGSPSGPGLLRRALVSWFLRLDWAYGLAQGCSKGA